VQTLRGKGTPCEGAGPLPALLLETRVSYPPPTIVKRVAIKGAETVFDQERFDGLARGLATGRLTRWQVLKGLGAGVLLGSAGLLQPWSASFAEAQTHAGKQASQGSPSNPRKYPVHAATCDEFNRKVETEGVTDEHGNPHPGAAGYTTYRCGSHTSYDVKITRKPGKVCLKVTQLKATFDKWSTATGKVTVADWRPTEPQSKGCMLEETWFREEVLDHERWHIGDINKVVAMATTRWRKRPPKFGRTCAGNETQARTALEEKIGNRADAECTRIEEDIIRRAKKYDANNSVPGMDCRNCCSEGQTVCDGYCADLLTDPNNCGQCGVRCKPYYGLTDCVNGKCDCAPGVPKCRHAEPGVPYYCCTTQQPVCCGKKQPGKWSSCCRPDEVCCHDAEGNGWCC
jgi:hypothetical protein